MMFQNDYISREEFDDFKKLYQFNVNTVNKNFDCTREEIKKLRAKINEVLGNKQESEV